MAVVDVEVFIDLFLKGKSLERFLVHVCQGTQGNVSDPITKTICTFITSPIQLTLTQVSLVQTKVLVAKTNDPSVNHISNAKCQSCAGGSCAFQCDPQCGVPVPVHDGGTKGVPAGHGNGGTGVQFFAMFAAFISPDILHF